MNILVLGCGYIGSEVAALWKKRGFYVTVTASHPEKLESLSRCAQKCVLLRSNDEEELAPLIASNDLILITTAVDDPENYDIATSQIIRHVALETDLPRHLIYLSTVTIYGDHNGQWVDETSELRATSDLAKTLIEAEKQILSLQELGWHICLLRLAEVYGPGRELSHRVKNLEGHILPGFGNHYTNMIHKLDAAAAVDYALRHHLEGIYNLSDDEHHSRRDLYDAISQRFQLPAVKWNPSHTPLHTGNKRVSNHKVKAEGFAFRHPLRILE
ncbi:MAG TPA: NAD-dependent epimerase/dehydratase family protein [Chlamydiales bacterium]|nr:NAD-dependent epimerase/dehydratase family protein [Chlamydiales bacterium]